MATNGNQIRESFVAGADLSSAQFTFVKMDTTDRTVVAAGNAEAAIGVLINDPTSGGAATVVTHGRVQVLCGTGGLTAGDTVGVDANGAAVTSATNDIIVGICIDGASAAEYATIDFFRGGNASA
jgi:hypothetical protein